MAEGARLESVFRGNSNVGSNPTLSAMTMADLVETKHNQKKINKLIQFSLVAFAVFVVPVQSICPVLHGKGASA